MFTTWSDFYSYVHRLDPKPAPGYKIPAGHTLDKTGKFPTVAECFVDGTKIVYEFDEDTGEFLRCHHGTNARAVYEQQKAAAKKPTAAAQRKTEPLSLRVTPDILRRMKNAAATDGISVNTFIAVAIAAALRSRNQ